MTQLLYASGDIAPQSGKNLQTFVWWEASLRPPPPLTIQMSVKLQEKLSTNHPQTWQVY